MKFFTFYKNNSGGSFDYCEDRDSDYFVIIEAYDALHANDIFISKGGYLNSVEDGYGYECCEDGWCPVEDYEAEDFPSLFGKDVRIVSYDPGKEIAVHYIDGKVEWY